jgi:NADH-quinone oxidoreductase subunit L
MVAAALAWITLFAPLIACAVIALFTLSSKKTSSTIAITGLGIGFICSLALWGHILAHPAEVPIQNAISWIQIGGLTIEMGILIDPLSRARDLNNSSVPARTVRSASCRWTIWRPS